MSYTITKYKDVYTLTNTDGVNSLDYIITQRNGCYNYVETQALATLLITETADIDLKKKDGEYVINITQNAVDTSITIKTYYTLLVSAIEDIDLMLCGCDCSDCDDCAQDCNEKLTTILKLLSYVSLTYPQYNISLDKVSETIGCLLGIDVSCLLVNEKITGLSDNTDLLKKIVSIYYLALYFTEKIQSADDEEIDYVDTKYKFNIISPCISRLGIDITDVETTINNNMGIITMNSGAYVNLPPDNVGNNTIGIANRATYVYTLADFTTNTTPAYSDPEGDPVDALRVDSLPADGVVKLSGVAVIATDVIPVASITGGLLTFEAPNQDPLDTDTWNFSLRDTGSLQWSS
jgi:hypothetical protein